MKRWGYVIAVVAVLTLGSVLAGVRHGALLVRMAEERDQAQLVQADRARSDQLQVELFAEGLAVRAATRIQAELQRGRQVAPGVILQDRGPLRQGQVATVTGQVVVESVEDDTYWLQSEATCEVVEAWSDEPSTHHKQASFAVEITAERIGDLTRR